MSDLTRKIDLNLIEHKIISIDDLPMLRHFKCGNGAMDLFLQTEAYPSHIERESSTTLVYYKSVLVGYYTLRHTNMSELFGSANK